MATPQKTFGARTFASNGVASQSLGIPTAAYPGRIAGNSDLIVAVDRQQTTLLLSLTAAAASMTVLDPSMMAAYSLLSIDNEIVKTTGPPAGNVVPIARGFDGTTPAIHQAGALVSGLVDAYHHNALVAEIEAIETALGPNFSTAGSGSSPFVVSAQYNFSPQTPGGTLSSGAQVITLTPVPKGVNGTDTNHWLYISGGTGAAESAKIVGGTAVSGAPSGTVIVQCANAHSGAWTIQSSTAGIQEALNIAGPQGVVWISGGTWPVANLWLNSVARLFGAGVAQVKLTPIAGVTAGTLFTVFPSGSFGNNLGLEIAGFTIDVTSQPAMNPMSIDNIARSHIHDLYLIGGTNGLTLGTQVYPPILATYNFFDNIRIQDSSNHGLHIHGEGASENIFDFIDVQITGNNNMTAGVYIYRTSSTDLGGHYFNRLRCTSISNGTMTNGLVGIGFPPGGILLKLIDCIFDNIGLGVSATNGPGSCVWFTNCYAVNMIGCWFTSDNPSSGAIYIDGGGGIEIIGSLDILATNGTVKGPAFNLVNACTQIIIVGNQCDAGSLGTIFNLSTTSPPTSVVWGYNNTTNIPMVPAGQELTLCGALSTYPVVSGPIQMISHPSGPAWGGLDMFDPVAKLHYSTRNSNGILQNLNNANTVCRSIDQNGNQFLKGASGCGNSTFALAPGAAGLAPGSLIVITDSPVTTGSVTAGGGTHQVLAASSPTAWVVVAALS